jgi:hypothetical protein
MSAAPRPLCALLLLSACSDPLEVPGDGGVDAAADVAPFDAGKELDRAPEPPDGPLECEFRVTEGPDFGVPDCPAAVPVEGSPCQPLTGLGICGYPGACDLDDWTCAGGRWTVTRGRSCTTCPATEPAQGASCAQLGKSRPSYLCAWAVTAGYSYGRCYNCHWELVGSLRQADCPATLPAAGGACSSTGLDCYYASACHSRDRATCEQGKWQVKPGACY